MIAATPPTSTDSASICMRNACMDVTTLDSLELVRLLLPRATKTKNVKRVQLLRSLLEEWGGLAGLCRASADELADALSGLGPDRAREAALRLAAAFELGRRTESDLAKPPVFLRDRRDVGTWGMARLGGLEHEELWLLAVDGRSRLRLVCRVAQGGLHGTSVRASDPLRWAIRAAASGFVLVHNHPSGDPTPSREDVQFTASIAKAAEVISVPLLDHVVVTRDAYASVPVGVEP